MPSVIAETDSFPATVQRPNNGELADAASLLQALQPLTNRTKYNYNRGRGAQFDITRAPFNADPTGGSLSTTAIQSAIAAAASAGGHVFSPPGIFRHGPLTRPSGVSILGVPESTFWVFNDASGNGIVTTGYNEGTPDVIQDIRFLANVPYTGTHFLNNTSGWIHFVRCAWNGFEFGGAPSNNLQGKILRSAGSFSKNTFIDCAINVAGDVTAGLDCPSGEITVIRGKVSMPETFSTGNRLIYIGERALIDGVTFDCSAHVGGTPSAIFAAASSSVCASAVRLKTVGGGDYLFDWEAGAKLRTSLVEMDGFPLNMYRSTAKLAPGSRLERNEDAIYYALGTSSGFTIPIAYACAFLNFEGAVPSVTLPPALHSGQRQRIIIRNASGASWGGPPNIGPINTIYDAAAVPVVAPLSGPRVLDFEVIDNGTTYPTPSLIWALMRVT